MSPSEEGPLDPDRLQASAARDQLWASLRVLLPEIRRVADGHIDNSERGRQVIQLLARIVVAEMDFRGNEGADPDHPKYDI